MNLVVPRGITDSGKGQALRLLQRRFKECHSGICEDISRDCVEIRRRGQRVGHVGLEGTEYFLHISDLVCPFLDSAARKNNRRINALNQRAQDWLEYECPLSPIFIQVDFST